MITTEIYIERKRLDITDDMAALITFTIDDIKDFASRNTSFSKTINLPGTANNNLLFGHIFDARVSNFHNAAIDNVGTNFNAAKSAQCIIFQNHVQVFKGVLRLLEVVINSGVPEYEVAVFGELGGLICQLGNKKLQDLDFSSYDHVWSVANIQSSWDNTTGAGYYYPLIDYGLVSTNKVDYDIQAFRTALFVREYLDKIFTATGYTYSCDLFDTARFKKLIVPHNQKAFTKSTTLQLKRGAASQFVDDAVSFLVVFNDGTGTIGSFTTSDYMSYTFAGASAITANIACSIILEDYTAFPDSLTLTLRKNGVSIKAVATTVAGTFDLGVTDVALSPGDILDVRISSIILTRVVTLSGSLQVNSSAPVAVPFALGDTVTMNDIIPKNILQIDFLSSIIKLFNLYIYEDKNKHKFLNIEPYVDFYNVTGITDWTYKMDRVRERRLRPMSELNSRIYNFKFKDDADYYNDLYKKRYNETYGSNVYDSEFEFANDSTTIELVFSPTVLVGYAGLDKVVSTIFKQTNGTEERIDSNIRILQTKKLTGLAAWDIENATVDVVSNLTVCGYAGHYDDPVTVGNDLHFGAPQELFFILTGGTPNVNQFNVYWSPYMAEITHKDSKLLVAYFKINNKEIYDLDFSKFIFLDGSLWRLNKIVDWNARYPDVCKCELLKVIYTIY